jgi:repressor LexA
LAKELLPDANIFMLSVKGDSMINAGIFSGDYVLVQSTNTAENGDIVVALIEDEATIKRFYKESGRYRLQPENPFMEPITVKDLIILGKVVGLYRKL